MSLYWLFLFCTVSYVLGSINFSIIISARRKRDVRSMGSGNPGTMNMLRNFGFKMGFLIVWLDVFKGIVPALVGYLCFDASFGDRQIGLYACGLAVVIGHCFPIFFKFRGGKGVATIIGVFLVANPLVGFVAFVLTFIFDLIFEYNAVGSFLFVTFMVLHEAITTFDNTDVAVCALLFVFYFLVWYTHRENIFRLLTGRENTASILKKIKQRNLKKRQERWLESLRAEGQ